MPGYDTTCKLNLAIGCRSIEATSPETRTSVYKNILKKKKNDGQERFNSILRLGYAWVLNRLDDIFAIELGQATENLNDFSKSA